MGESREELETMAEARLAERFPEVELVDLEVRGGPAGTLTLFVAVVDEFVAELRGRRRKPAAETALHNE